MRMLEEFCPGFAEKMDDLENEVKDNMPFDEKTYQLICLALAIKSRSAPCVRKHFRGALMAGATVKQVSYTLALVMRESAGADDCWTHDVIGDWTELLKEDFHCSCMR